MLCTICIPKSTMLRETSLDIDDSANNATKEPIDSPSSSVSDGAKNPSLTWSLRQAWQKRPALFQREVPADTTSAPQEASEGNTANGSSTTSNEETTARTTFNPNVPGWISLTVMQQFSPPDERTTIAWGLTLEKDEETREVVIQSVSSDSFISIHSGAEETNLWFRPGDIVSALNQIDCRTLSIEDIISPTLQQNQGFVTLQIRRPTGNPDLLEAILFTLNQRDSTEQQATENDEVDDLEEITDDADHENDTEPEQLPIGLRLEEFDLQQSTQEPSSSQRDHFVKIAQVDKTGFLAQSILQTGDEIVSIDGMDMRGLCSEEVDCILNSKFWEAPFVTIRVQRKAGRWSLRRAAVAVGGGAMVGVGSVIMATPLHPIGHAMAIGGVAVLGTEFEAPRRIVNSAKKGFQKTFGKKEGGEMDQEQKESESDEGGMDSQKGVVVDANDVPSPNEQNGSDKKRKQC